MQHKPAQMNPNWCVIVFNGELNNIKKKKYPPSCQLTDEILAYYYIIPRWARMKTSSAEKRRALV